MKSIYSTLSYSSSLSTLTDTNISNPSNGQILKYRNGYWINSSSSGLSPVQSVFGRIGDILAQSNDYSINQITNSSILSDSNNINIATPLNNQYLKYNGTKWVNSQIEYSQIAGTPFVPSTLGQLSDVSLTGPANTQALTYDGGFWKNSNMSEGFTAWQELASQNITAARNTFYFVDNCSATMYSTYSLNEQVGFYVANGNQLNITFPAGTYLSANSTIYTGPFSMNSPVGTIIFKSVGQQIWVISTMTSTFFINSSIPITVGSSIYSTYGVSINTPLSGQVLRYDGTNFVNSYPDVISFNSRTGNVLPVEGDYSLNLLSDVVISTPASREAVVYNGTNFVNAVKFDYQTLSVNAFGAAAVKNTHYVCGNLGGTFTITPDIVGSRYMFTASASINITFSGTSFVINSYLGGGTSNPTFVLVDGTLELVCYFNSGQTYYNITNISLPLSTSSITLNGQKIADSGIEQLRNVIITTPSVDEALTYNGSNWVNSHLPHCMPTAELTFCNTATPYALTLTTQNTYYIIAPTTTLVSNNAEFISGNKFDMPVNGRLRYIGTETMAFHSAFSICSAAATAGDNYRLAAYKNGVVDSQTYFNVDYNNNNIYTSTAFHKIFTLATNDYIEIRMTDLSSNNKVINFINFNIVLMATCMAH